MPPKFLRRSIETFWVPFLEKAQRELASLPTIGPRHSFVAQLGTGVGALMQGAHLFPDLTPNDANHISNTWCSFVMDELAGFNGYGSGAVATVCEAVLKAQAITNIWQSAASARTPIFFRGEVNFDWPLVPRITRKLGVSHDLSNPRSATTGELDALRDFQSRCARDASLLAEAMDGRPTPPSDAAEWWELMQHYDQDGGTRMLDITSSVFCGLFFACADWDGAVDEATDGALHFLPAAPGRGDKDSPARGPRGDLREALDQAQHSAPNFFDIEVAEDTIRFRRARGRNPRLLAQDGFFLWQPRFAEPAVLNQHFKFRVPGATKKHLLRELYSLGYTAERIVRGDVGRKAHATLTASLGVPVA